MQSGVLVAEAASNPKGTKAMPTTAAAAQQQTDFRASGSPAETLARQRRQDPPFAVRAGTRPRHIIEAHIPRVLAVLQRCTVVWTRNAGIEVDTATGTPMVPLCRSEVTCFHSSAVPPVSVEKYVTRIATHSTYGADGIAFGIVLLSRYMVATGTIPNVFTIHRLMLACIAVGMKVNNDLFYKNKYLASVGGIPVQELNAMETALINALGYQCIVSLAELESVIEGVAKADTPDKVRDVCVASAKRDAGFAGATDPVPMLATA